MLWHKHRPMVPAWLPEQDATSISSLILAASQRSASTAGAHGAAARPPGAGGVSRSSPPPATVGLDPQPARAVGQWRGRHGSLLEQAAAPQPATCTTSPPQAGTSCSASQSTAGSGSGDAGMEASLGWGADQPEPVSSISIADSATSSSRAGPRGLPAGVCGGRAAGQSVPCCQHTEPGGLCWLQAQGWLTAGWLIN